LQVHAEVNELPLDSFFLVLFLLEDEHVMIEELLQTLVGVVDAQLLERVILTTNGYVIVRPLSTAFGIHERSRECYPQ